MTVSTGTTGSVVWAATGAPIAGEICSGDLHLVVAQSSATLIAVVDGLGHGPEAHEAAVLAIATLAGAAEAPLTSLFELCHEALQRTRGVVMTAALVADGGTMEWLAVGNVEGVVMHAGAEGGREGIVGRGGIVGSGRLPSLRTATIALQPDDLIVMATDGIRSEFTSSFDASGSSEAIASRVLERHARGYDDALVLVARYQGAR